MGSAARVSHCSISNGNSRTLILFQPVLFLNLRTDCDPQRKTKSSRLKLARNCFITRRSSWPMETELKQRSLRTCTVCVGIVLRQKHCIDLDSSGSRISVTARGL